MGLLRRAVATLAGAGVTESRLPLSLMTGGVTSLLTGVAPGAQLGQLRAYGTVGWLFAVVSRITAGVAAIRWHTYTGPPDKRVERPDHPAARVWSGVNDFYTTIEFIETIQQHLELVGEAWIHVISNAAGTPVELWPLRPDRMSPVPDRDEYIVGYVYRAPGTGQPIPIPREDIIFLRQPSPLDPYRGHGVVQAIIADLEGERLAAEWNRNFFYNSAEPGGVVELPEMNPQEFSDYVLTWRQNHQGTRNAHRIAFLPNAKWVERKYTQRDMQFKDLRLSNRDTVLGAFGMPHHLMGLSEGMSRANAEASQYMFAQWLLVPRAERLKQALNERFAPRFGPDVSFDFDDPTPVDADQQLREGIEGYKADILDLNEARRRLGEDAVADGAMRMPLERTTKLVTAATELVRAGFDPQAALSFLGLPPITYSGPLPSSSPSAPPKMLTLTTSPLALPAPVRKDVRPPGVVEGEQRMADGWERRLRVELRAIIAYLQSRKDTFGVTKLDLGDADGIDWDWNDRYSEDVIAEMVAVYIAAAKATAPAWTPTLAQAAATEYARHRAGELLKLDGAISMTSATRERVRELVAETIREGHSLRELEKALREDHAFSRDRAAVVSRTESATALGQGAKKAAKAQGLQEKRWITQGDELVEEDCLQNEAAGWIAAGDIFPTGVDTIPQHPRCLPGHVRVLASGVAGVTSRLFDGMILVLTTESGRVLYATPEHRVMTDQGWEIAGRVRVGAKVLCSDCPSLVGGEGQPKTLSEAQRVADLVNGYDPKKAKVSNANPQSPVGKASREPLVPDDAENATLRKVRKAVETFAGSSCLEAVEKVEGLRYSARVYNLETAGRWYIANGVVVHNCRCNVRYRAKPLTQGAASLRLVEARCPQCGKKLETDVPAGLPLWCRRCKAKVLPVRSGQDG